ncbi:fimbrial protein [Citrobacter amalonaticus]|uniref:fimbrial protein n=1 Tax=Citrobacter amalonaticus TaxID=35703 RepID=UPI003D6FAFB3
MGKFKLSIFCLALLSGGLTTCSAYAAASPGGIINFTGNIITAGCKTDMDGTHTKDVPMDTVDVSNFTGQTAGPKGFDIVLTECAEGTQVKGYFSASTAVVNSSGRLENASTDSAPSNVTLQLLDANNSDAVIDVGSSAQKADGYTTIPASKGATLSYIVQYYNEAGTVTAGPVESNVLYSLDYK